MGKKVYANGMEIAHEAGANKVVAAFPDVCLSPPSPPTGPIPVPYPDTSTSSDLEEGSNDVTIGGKSIALHGQSYYMSSPLGNEAATKSLGGSVLTKTITGKTYFQASSMNVSVEGKKVNRHLDITTSNHGSQPPGTPPVPGLESMSMGGGDDGGDDDDSPKCPCCGDDAHPNQLGEDGKLSPTVSQDQYYADKTEHFTSRRQQMADIMVSRSPPNWATRTGTDNNPLYNGLPVHEIITKKGDHAEASLRELRELTVANPDCPNLHHPPDSGCGTHFEPNGQSEAARNEFDKMRHQYLLRYRRENPQHAQVSGRSQVNHKTPLDAGGCPVSSENLIPDPVLEGPCAQIETLQTRLQSF